ncbi:bifunctional [glutamine synthetase] adenylyltransferase/[glutamine synthetase]-adenylyl-L-tyrosine phosphorylase [Nocardioides marmoribigeumensis]|uniref:Bifunctional glutamine synthetase adenylyltransferase/adenylyl-removing enzyme n=1 Tax=Nocardioides marmoribigeumensis TaxID=433649 RepID=A0ABU2BQ36_9ACTN|nr:bifunctional [glutamine synthetase] adenylyltransferase/[glutamine synthetase]-adenylyl-L-tyrosine phosphorylase [Nocardioides marmoribigeumensis]MDR7360735.1 glutamate-ammonia-ligase adenylyltransferase [Nocardioides marmoribigeumensis]
MSRQETPRGQLRRLGFQQLDRSERALEKLGEHASVLLGDLGSTADPDLALDRLVDLATCLDQREDGAGVAMLRLLARDDLTAHRLLRVLGASNALGHHLLRHPDHWEDLADPLLDSARPAAYAVRARLLEAVGADPAADVPVAQGDDAELCDVLRVTYRRLLLGIAARDLAHRFGMADVAAELSDLAAGVLEAALAVARQRVGAEDAATARLAVIAMGKCGAHELNYVSDVDVVFVAEAAEGADEQQAHRVATQLASHLVKICSDHTPEGTIWPVDAGLRPEGKHGPLVRTLASHVGYYERWAKTWEFQALLKARPVAGDLDLGHVYVEALHPMVWEAAQREGFVSQVQAMRRRVVAHIPAKEADRQLKLGSGGLRDVEFAVQLLQMVHGRHDESIRIPTTMAALEALTEGAYIGRPDGQALLEAYSFLRTVEHRLQLFGLRRTALIPQDEESLRRLGRSLGFFKDPMNELAEALKERRREVRRLHEKLFYRPLLASVVRAPGSLSEAAAKDRLSALGYLDPDAALRHLAALSEGTSRTAAIQRTLLPVMLEWFADAPYPDAGLLGFRKISEALGRTPWYLSMLRDEGEVAERMARILASSRYATSLLQREPNGVKLLAGDQLVPQDRETLQTEMLAAAMRQSDGDAAIGLVRGVRRRELLRIAAADLSGVVDDVEQVSEALTDLTHATLEAALAIAVRRVGSQRETPLPTRLAIVSMGRLGGHEVGYGSDADVLFVHEPVEGAEPEDAARAAQAVANELRRLLGTAGSDPALEVDADLRPEGKGGPLVRTVESYAAYYSKWSAVWEAQALLRAEAVVGDEGVCGHYMELVDRLRFPGEGLSFADVREIRRIKARVDNERLPRGADRKTHLKLGRGGLGDIEWTVQLLQMRHAHNSPGLRTTRTLPALRAAVEEGFVEAEDAQMMTEAWLMVSRIRNLITLVRGKPSDELPRETGELTALSVLMGYSPDEADALVNDYLRVTRRAHAVVERVFWGG